MTKWRFPVGTEERSENTAGDDGAIKPERSVLTFQKDLLPPKSGNLTEDNKIHTSRRDNLNSTITAESQFGPNVNQTRSWAYPLYTKQWIKTGDMDMGKNKEETKSKNYKSAVFLHQGCTNFRRQIVRATKYFYSGA